MTETLNQYREDDRQQRKADQDEDQAREDRMVALWIAEREEDKEQRVEERKEAKSMKRMLMSMMTRNTQQLQASSPHVTQPDDFNNSINNNDAKWARIGTQRVMELDGQHQSDPPQPPLSEDQH